VRLKNPPPSLKLLASPHLDAVARVAEQLARRGWAEANAGNFSIRLGALADFRAETSPMPAGLTARLLSPLAGRALLVKTAGARMSDIARDPRSGICLLRVHNEATGFLRLGKTGPTSELPAHLAAHAVLARSRPEHTCVLHTHPTALIALSLVTREPTRLLRTLSRAHAEMELVKGRLAALPFILPGSSALARSTGRALRRCDAVIWPRHGIIATGTDLERALDLIEICDKAADIALRAKCATTHPRG